MRIVQFAGAESGSPDSPEWHAWRAQGIGGSDAAVIASGAGLNPDPPSWQKSANQLFKLKTGQAQDDFKGNWATERGRAGEPIVRAAYEEATGVLISPMFGEMDEHPATRCSFDGLSMDFSVITEIKCMGQANHALALAGEIVPYYKPQLAHQGLVAWGDPGKWNPDGEIHFVSGVPELLVRPDRDLKAALAVVPRKARTVVEFAKRLYEAEVTFWQKVTQGIQEGGKASLAGDGWDDLARLWHKAVADAKIAAEDRQTIEGLMLSLVQNRRLPMAEGAGVRFQESSRKGSVDYAKFCQERGITDAELEAYRKPDTFSWGARAIKE